MSSPRKRLVPKEISPPPNLDTKNDGDENEVIMAHDSDDEPHTDAMWDLSLFFFFFVFWLTICLSGLPRSLQNYLALKTIRLPKSCLEKIRSRNLNSRRKFKPWSPNFSQVVANLPSISECIYLKTFHNLNVPFQWFHHGHFEKRIFVGIQAEPRQNAYEKVLSPRVTKNTC